MEEVSQDVSGPFYSSYFPLFDYSLPSLDRSCFLFQGITLSKGFPYSLSDRIVRNHLKVFLLLFLV